jgi:hypothetical protein
MSTKTQSDINDSNRHMTLLGVIDYIEEQGGVIVYDGDFDRSGFEDGTLLLRIDQQRHFAWFQCIGERWMIQLTMCTCCPAIDTWEPFYFESSTARVGQRQDENFPGAGAAIRAARSWVLDRQMKSFPKAAKGKGFGS